MTDITVHSNNLPVKLEDLAKFVLVGREKLTAVRALIKAMDRIEMAAGVREQKIEEAQMLAEALLDAEARIGELAIEIPKATGHQAKRGNQYKSGESSTAATFSTTKQDIIEDLGFNKFQIQRFQTLAANKDIIEEAKAEARANDDIVNRTMVLKAIKEKEIEERRNNVRETLQKQDLQVTDKKYRIIYADPPWKYGNAMPDYVTEPQDYYLLMDTADICAMPVKDLIEDDAVLFLWSTSPHLPEALEVVKAWGFNYKTTFIWDKVKHNMGHYNSVRHEILLVCTKGACTPDVKKLFDSVVSIERTEHSKKPEYFREIIETLYTYGNKIELFSRSAPDGWDVFGNQAS